MLTLAGAFYALHRHPAPSSLTHNKNMTKDMASTDDGKMASITSEPTREHAVESSELAAPGNQAVRLLEGAEMYHSRETVDKYGYVARR